MPLTTRPARFSVSSISRNCTSPRPGMIDRRCLSPIAPRLPDNPGMIDSPRVVSGDGLGIRGWLCSSRASSSLRDSPDLRDGFLLGTGRRAAFCGPRDSHALGRRADYSCCDSCRSFGTNTNAGDRLRCAVS